MAKIAPFKAVTYNQELVPDLQKVVCPPYDVISRERQDYYHELSPYNFIHVLLSKDTDGEDKYLRAGGIFREWLKKKILIQDEKPAVYFYSQQYSLRGEKKTRYGFIARLFLEEKKSTFGHEHTHLEPKEDRLRLLRAVKANLSPIFVVFEDKKRIIQAILQRYSQGKKPFIEMTDDERIAHRVWRIDDDAAIQSIQKGMAQENVFIADGHHRYEVACTYRDEVCKGKAAFQETDCDYILAYFTNTDSRGLTILPIHRYVSVKPGFDFAGFLANLKSSFDIEEIKDKARFFFLMEKGGRTEHVIGMYHAGRFRLLRLKNVKLLDRLISDKPAEYRSLDVSILNYLILKGILGIDTGQKDTLFFSPYAEEMLERAKGDPGALIFFLNPVRIQQIMSVALRQEKMPPKSTYFYPKVVSGLLVNRHEQ